MTTEPMFVPLNATYSYQYMGNDGEYIRMYVVGYRNSTRLAEVFVRAKDELDAFVKARPVLARYRQGGERLRGLRKKRVA